MLPRAVIESARTGDMTQFGDTVDRQDIDRFAAQSDGWWNPHGGFAPLHQINPARIDFIRRIAVAHFGRDERSLRPFSDLHLADIGCGGGLVAEPMARLGFSVTGIDAAGEAIGVARRHAGESGLSIDYRIADIETLAAAGDRFDVVLALEIVEHVADIERFFGGIGKLVRPGGLFIGATLNRTAKAFALAVVGAEYVLGWLPRGTHNWRQFVRPSEFVLRLRRAGLRTHRLAGLVYDLRSGTWRESEDLSVNYMLAAVRG
jgi:2-polyprenyl-6-hydroxyphenyl methylase/3-demethylubiquinone-9 3-methyltransferase